MIQVKLKHLQDTKMTSAPINLQEEYNKTEILPILPIVATLDKFETPQTIEKNTTGTISIFKDDINNNKFDLNKSDNNTHTIAYREDAMFIKENFCRQIGSIANKEICHGYLIAAGFLFSTKEFVKQIPYDSDFYFYGEEISLMLRAFTRGFGIFHIPAAPIFHLYADISEVKRKLHWDEDEDNKRTTKWFQRESKSIDKLSDIINDRVEGIFGLGDKRVLKDYEFLSGVDLVNKKILDKGKAFTGKFISSLPWDKDPY